jgi:hypothetical protein
MDGYPSIKNMIMDGLDGFLFLMDGLDWIFLKNF